MEAFILPRLLGGGELMGLCMGIVGGAWPGHWPGPLVLQQGFVVDELGKKGAPGDLSGPRLASEAIAALGSW